MRSKSRALQLVGDESIVRGKASQGATRLCQCHAGQRRAPTASRGADGAAAVRSRPRLRAPWPRAGGNKAR